MLDTYTLLLSVPALWRSRSKSVAVTIVLSLSGCGSA